MKPLLERYAIAREEHDLVLTELSKETERVVSIMTKFFKVRDYWWAYDYYSCADDEEPLPQEVDDGFFPIYIEATSGSGCVTDSTDYNSGFPVKFFDMTEKEIVEFLQKEVDECEEEAKREEEKELKKKSEKSAKRSALKASALSKLTPEEKRVLKLK